MKAYALSAVVTSIYRPQNCTSWGRSPSRRSHPRPERCRTHVRATVEQISEFACHTPLLPMAPGEGLPRVGRCGSATKRPYRFREGAGAGSQDAASTYTGFSGSDRGMASVGVGDPVLAPTLVAFWEWSGVGSQRLVPTWCDFRLICRSTSYAHSPMQIVASATSTREV